MNLRWTSGEVSQQFQKEKKEGEITTNLSRKNMNSQCHKLCVCTQNQNKNKNLLFNLCLLILPYYYYLSSLTCQNNSWNDKHPGKSKVEVCLTLPTVVATTSTQTSIYTTCMYCHYCTFESKSKAHNMFSSSVILLHFAFQLFFIITHNCHILFQN